MWKFITAVLAVRDLFEPYDERRPEALLEIAEGLGDHILQALGGKSMMRTIVPVTMSVDGQSVGYVDEVTF